ncbi:Hypothetical_protein [Hexamita inflata]|uniref:Hypothetical_protein n=1 Tax=Hexamita inflata TaxID=28002 RepID=A0AA86UYK7_9EUKA|nr:Hypothetical protein HINF_LOCUS40593 [Hexamita inflata]
MQPNIPVKYQLRVPVILQSIMNSPKVSFERASVDYFTKLSLSQELNNSELTNTQTTQNKSFDSYLSLNFTHQLTINLKNKTAKVQQLEFRIQQLDGTNQINANNLQILIQNQKFILQQIKAFYE